MILLAENDWFYAFPTLPLSLSNRFFEGRVEGISLSTRVLRETTKFPSREWNLPSSRPRFSSLWFLAFDSLTFRLWMYGAHRIFARVH
jgi:hypothetical protein